MSFLVKLMCYLAAYILFYRIIYLFGNKYFRIYFHICKQKKNV